MPIMLAFMGLIASLMICAIWLGVDLLVGTNTLTGVKAGACVLVTTIAFALVFLIALARGDL